MKRRDLIVGTAVVVGGSALSLSSAYPQTEFTEFVPPDFSQEPVNFPEGSIIPTAEQRIEQAEIQNTGADAPLRKEIDLGNALLKAIPTNGTPYDIAYEFHKWRKELIGKTDEERRVRSYYSREWPQRGNPVIMQFFDATGFRSPVGDTTWWCSAFVSWCIARCNGGLNSTNKVWPFEKGAASASYRAWGDDVLEKKSTPRKGDLAVFQNTSVSYQGHIGFVHEVQGDLVLVLGGNQGAQNEYNGGEVNISAFDIKKTGRLKFHSFRRHKALG